MLMRTEDSAGSSRPLPHVAGEASSATSTFSTISTRPCAYLGPAIDRNFEVWGYTFEEYLPLQPESRNPDSFEDAVEDMKDFIRERGAWMDEYIEVVQQYGHPSAVKKYNH